MSLEEQQERTAAFQKAIDKLEANREKVPLEQLNTRYAKAYNALCKEVEDGAEWYAEEYLSNWLRFLPEEKAQAILQREKAEGGRIYDLKKGLVECPGKHFEFFHKLSSIKEAILDEQRSEHRPV